MTIMEAGVRQRLLRHLDNCIAEVDTDLRPPPQSGLEERLQPPDSSTAEEVNNNGRDPSLHLHPQDLTAAPHLPTKMMKTYDGNFVFVLPSHYVQLASALGINIKPQNEPSPEATQQQSSSSPTIKQEKEEPPQNCANEAEKPIDFSKNNESQDMWRPW